MGDIPGAPKEQDSIGKRNIKDKSKTSKEKVKISPGEHQRKKDSGEKTVKKSVGEKSSPRVWFSPSEYKLRQNLPPQLPRRPTDIYLTSHSEGKEEQVRASKLLQEGQVVWLHSIGSNIPKCITIVNKLSSDFDTLEVENFSHTWELSDNWSCLEEVGPRYNSGLHVRCRIVV